MISNWYTTLLSNGDRHDDLVQSKYLSSAGSCSPTTVTVSPIVIKKKNTHR
jgi:hypothetical protein